MNTQNTNPPTKEDVLSLMSDIDLTLSASGEINVFPCSVADDDGEFERSFKLNALVDGVVEVYNDKDDLPELKMAFAMFRHCSEKLRSHIASLEK